MLSNHVSELKDISFLAVIFDEVHKLKNVTTKINEVRCLAIRISWLPLN